MTSHPDLFSGEVEAVIFDLDGVITDTASVHATAWDSLFNEFLARRLDREFPNSSPFGLDDYHAYIDGKPRYEGVASFLASRDIALPYGEPHDGPGETSVCALGNKKNELFRASLVANGATVFPTSVQLIAQLREKAVPVACVSSSKNCRYVLDSVALLGLFDDIVDGTDAAERGLAGKPSPETYLASASALGADPAKSAMVEDALSGVASGAAGGFRHVIGVDRGAGRTELLAAGATVVVDDLGALLEGNPSAAT